MASSKRSSALVERSPVYYGWVVLGISTLGMAATLPGQTAGIMGGFAPILWILTPIPLGLAVAAFVGRAVDWDRSALVGEH